jgi:sterol 24-C-methyltransferase
MEMKDVLILGAVAVAAWAMMPPGALSTPIAAGLLLLLALLGPMLLAGVKQTVTFLLSMSESKKQTSGRIDGYTKQFSGEKSTGDRNEDYASLVNDYYDLATEFYEWGWGTSFHFADRRKGESFHQSILRHEYYLAGRLGVNKGSLLLDCGCGVGGPARNIAKFTESNIKAITINQFQVDRGNTLCKREGLEDQVQLVQGDFMKLPFPDNHFDGVYAIESTCHAPDRLKVYGEIMRVLKPGGIFACYEWCVTDAWDEKNEHHQKIKLDIMLGDGLPDLVHTSVCTAALGKAGFEVLEARDMAGGSGEGGEPWHMPLMPSWNPTKWPRFQFNPVMYRLMPVILRFFEKVRLVPAGTVDTQVMLQAGGVGCAQGGHTGSFTPMWLMVGRKPR